VPVEIAAGSLVLTAVKAAYELWKENRADVALALTADARAVLKTMQSDTTGNGIFLDSTRFGSTGLHLICPYQARLRIETTRRVVAELEAKGLVEPHVTSQGKEGVQLTHFGWILNPETGKADKVG